MCPRGMANRVNLGLIPSSEAGWATACAALRDDSGGILHVHANVTSNDVTSNRHETRPLGQQTSPCTQVRTCGLDDSSCKMNGAQSDSADIITDSTCNTGMSNAVSTEREQLTNNGADYKNKQISGLVESIVERNAETSGQCSNSTDTTHASGCTNDNTVSSVGVDSVTSAAARVRMMKFAKTCVAKPAWHAWADTACDTLRCHLSDMQRCDWSVSVIHIEHVKSYAPHIDHIVVDIECRPPSYGVNK